MLEAAQSPPINYPGLPMARFGAIPEEFGGGNKYRVIWAPSRFVTLTGRDKTMTISMYSGPHAIEPVGDFWILEGWKSPYDLCRMTAEQWNADPMMLNTGPFPSRGDYVRHETLAINPSDANIEKLITWIEEGGKRRSVENMIACQANMEKDTANRKRLRKEIVDNAQRPYGAVNPMAGYGGGRSTKTAPILHSREELGLPDAGTTTAVRVKNPAVYEIPQEAA